VGDCVPIHSDVIVIIVIYEFSLVIMSTVFGDDRVRDLKTKTDALDEIYGLLGANLSQGPCFNPLSKLIDRDE
jgi:hypothetical protein